MPDIYIIRHAHVDYATPDGITANNPLTPLGHTMSGLLAERCDGFDLEHLVVSSMPRTQQTAAPILARFPEMPYTVSAAWREISVEDLDDFDGPPAPEDMYYWQTAHWEHANRRMWPRVQQAWRDLLAMCDERGYQRVGVVTHGCVINAIYRQVRGEPIERLRTEWIDIDWSAVSVFHANGDGSCTIPLWNNARHIDPLRDQIPTKVTPTPSLN